MQRVEVLRGNSVYHRSVQVLRRVQHLLPLAGGKPELIRDLLEFRRIFGREIARLVAARASAETRWRRGND
jgi:DNA-binding FadR family transcriptional regulator